MNCGLLLVVLGNLIINACDIQKLSAPSANSVYRTGCDIEFISGDAFTGQYGAYTPLACGDVKQAIELAEKSEK